MFIDAIEENLKHTRALLTGKLIYRNFEIINGISTLIVLNDEGDILTTSHVAELFLIADETSEVYYPILDEMKNKPKKEIAKIESKYGIKDDTILALHNIIVDIAENPGHLNIIKHPALDMAIIKMENTKNLFVKDFPKFRKSNLLIGENVCKLGFAFPEYDTFFLDEKTNRLSMHNKVMHFPIFPLDAIVTRNILDPSNEISMFEMSTPCLPGQSGGPVFDNDGYICGMQIGTKRITSVYNNEMPFNLDLGIGIHLSSILQFLDDNNIKYNQK